MTYSDELKIKSGNWSIIHTTTTKYERHKHAIKKITKNKIVFVDLWSYWGDLPVLKSEITKVE